MTSPTDHIAGRYPPANPLDDEYIAAQGAGGGCVSPTERQRGNRDRLEALLRQAWI